MFSLESDEVAVVMEDSDGTDSPLTTLRATIQKLERSGSVDFELAGHSFERPPEVCQGAEQGDRLLGHTVCRRQSTLRFQVTVIEGFHGMEAECSAVEECEAEEWGELL